jgi:hypothetical protein
MLAHGHEEVFMQAHTYTSFAADFDSPWDGAAAAKPKNTPNTAIIKLARTQRLIRFIGTPPFVFGLRMPWTCNSRSQKKHYISLADTKQGKVQSCDWRNGGRRTPTSARQCAMTDQNKGEAGVGGEPIKSMLPGRSGGDDGDIGVNIPWQSRGNS